MKFLVVILKMFDLVIDERDTVQFCFPLLNNIVGLLEMTMRSEFLGSCSAAKRTFDCEAGMGGAETRALSLYSFIWSVLSTDKTMSNILF